jgi:hypothetical protein
VVVHSVLPERLAAAVDAVLSPAGLGHVAHGLAAPVRSSEVAAGDPEAVALVGPYRSADVAEAVEATAPAGLPLLAPAATAAAVTRDDEPGCDDPARHRGTVLRLLARDTVVAARIADHVRATGRRAFVVAGEHEYGRQLAGQLLLAGLPQADRPEEADVVVLGGLAGHPEIAAAAALAPLPIIAFDAVQGAVLGGEQDVSVALPTAPSDRFAPAELFEGVERAGHAAKLIVEGVGRGARDRAALLATMRELGPFDAHGDPVDPPVWLWRARDGWTLEPERAI